MKHHSVGPYRVLINGGSWGSDARTVPLSYCNHTELLCGFAFRGLRVLRRLS